MKAKDAIKLAKIDHSLGAVFSKNLIDKYRLNEGRETFEGILVAAYDAEFEKDMAISKEIMNKRRDALKILAK